MSVTDSTRIHSPPSETSTTSGSSSPPVVATQRVYSITTSLVSALMGGETSCVGPPSMSVRAAAWPGRPFCVTNARVPPGVASPFGAMIALLRNVGTGSACSHAPPVSDGSLVIVHAETSPSMASSIVSVGLVETMVV